MSKVWSNQIGFWRSSLDTINRKTECYGKIFLGATKTSKRSINSPPVTLTMNKITISIVQTTRATLLSPIIRGEANSSI